ncbi:MAG: hypothetical protein ABIO04_02210 [Ferruginibacter sp.]
MIEFRQLQSVPIFRKIPVLFLILTSFFTNANAQDCDIATTGVAVVNATNTGPALSGCVTGHYNFKFSIANFGSEPTCTIPANSVTATFDFPTITGGIKPFIYNGPASFNSGYFSWVYNSTLERLEGTNTIGIPNGLGDVNILVPVLGNAAGAGNGTLNLVQNGGISNNTSNDFSKAQLVVFALPVVSCPGNSFACLNSPAYTLSGSSPSGGIYSGAGVSGGQFSPSSAGLGTHTITYSYTNTNGCSNSCNFTISVSSAPVVTCSGNLTVCSNTNPFTLTGSSPAGGTYSGTGVTANQFNPAAAGPGTHTIAYSYTDPGGCSGSASCTFTITVNGSPIVSCPPNIAVCVNASPFILSGGSPAGGIYTGTGISSGQFNAANAGVGEHTITYTYTAANSCSNSCSFLITVNALPIVSYTGLASTYCLNASSQVLLGSPAGGTFSGPGISGNNFNPSVAGAGGPYTISYTYTSPSTGCSNIVSHSVSVNALPVVSFTGLASSYCSSSGVVTLSGSPSGGTFTGPGISGNTFNPALAGTGTHNIIYSYISPSTNCSNSMSQPVTVNDCSNITVSLKVFLQGYYIGGQAMQPVLNNQSVPSSLATQTDTIIVELHHPFSFALIESKKAILMTNGLVSLTFTQTAGNFYIAIKHRNSVQTWTKDPVQCTSSTPLYNFTIAANKAYQDNQVQVQPGVWAIFTGDINQDEFIDSNDFPELDNDSFNGVAFEYKATDLNGDGFIDVNDFPVYDNNSLNGVTSLHP